MEFTFTTPLSIETKDSGDVLIKGLITTGDQDLVNDIVTENCFKSIANQVTERNIKLDIEHEAFRGSNDTEIEINKSLIPAGRITSAKASIKGVEIEGPLNRHHRRYSEIKGSIEDKFLDSFSIAYIPIKVSYGEVKGTKVRYLEDVKLLNVALTGNPVNTHARFTDVVMKSLDAYEQENAKDTLLKMKAQNPTVKLEVKSTYTEEQLADGIKQEQEHAHSVNNDQSVIRQIAIDHLQEDPNYYEKMKRVENKSHSQKDNHTTERRINNMSNNISTPTEIKAEEESDDDKKKKKKEEEEAEMKKEKKSQDNIDSIKKELAELKALIAQNSIEAKNKAVSNAVVEQKDHSGQLGRIQMKSTMDIVRAQYGY